MYYGEIIEQNGLFFSMRLGEAPIFLKLLKMGPLFCKSIGKNSAPAMRLRGEIIIAAREIKARERLRINQQRTGRGAYWR